MARSGDLPHHHAASTDHGSVLPPRSSALVVSEEGELTMLMARLAKDEDVPRMVLLLGAVLVRSSDDEWVDEMLSIYDGATDG